ncbi:MULTISPECIES: hypothetical protein [unclassified Agrococcus]|uniref:hypothetical protein n=1 Tax=unclassified Agrococcus TaxID=2615065 RepID=UPI003608BF5E
MSAIRDRTDDGALLDFDRRLSEIETGSPQESATIERGMTRVASPDGTSFAAVGHAAGRSGFLLPSGGSWVTVQEWTTQRISELAGAADSRILALEGVVDTLSVHIGSLGSRASSLETTVGQHNSHIGSLGTRTTALETKTNQHDGHIGSLGSRLTAAEQRANAMQGSINAVIDYMTAIANSYNAHIDAFHSGGGKVPNNPPVKG